MKSKNKRAPIVTDAIVLEEKNQVQSIESAMSTDQQIALRALGIILC